MSYAIFTANNYKRVCIFKVENTLSSENLKNECTPKVVHATRPENKAR